MNRAKSASLRAESPRPLLVLFLIILQFVIQSAGTAMGGDAGSADIVTYELTNYGKREQNVAVTFGAVFARGDIPAGATFEAIDGTGSKIPLQIDRKASNADHSLRHAVVTLAFPRFAAGATVPVTLRRADGIAPNAAPITLSDLPPDFDATVVLTSKEHRFTASARALLSHAKPDVWLSGPYVAEWWIAEALHDEHGAAAPHLYVQYGIRSYGKDAPLRVEVDVENDWTWVAHPRTEFYDAQITLGGKTVFTKTGIVQPVHTRWREGFWWKDPVAVYVKQNLAYLKKARVIPNYDPDLVVSPSAVADMYRNFEPSDRGPMGAGILMKYMPTTGGRPDIAPLPQWQALYLLTMDPRMYQVTLQTADLGASFSSHYRNEKTGRPVTLEDYPNISTHSNYVGKPGQLQLPDTGGYTDPLVPDAAHEPALDFVPYLVTGDRFYLEELEFWSQWNAMGTAPGYHGFAKALVNWDQVRAQAWSLRTLAQAEFITPDADPAKSVLHRELLSNINWYDSTYNNNPAANALGVLAVADNKNGPDNGRGVAPWQDDFFTWTLDYVQSLGDVNALPLLRWKARFPVGRIAEPGYCWVIAAPYTIRLRLSTDDPFYTNLRDVYKATISAYYPALSDNTPCAGAEMASELGLPTPRQMAGDADNPGGYSAVFQAALAAAVDSGIPGSPAAWSLFVSRYGIPNYAADPQWAIVPWSNSLPH